MREFEFGSQLCLNTTSEGRHDKQPHFMGGEGREGEREESEGGRGEVGRERERVQ